jgi:hypothetical protein
MVETEASQDVMISQKKSKKSKNAQVVFAQPIAYNKLSPEQAKMYMRVRIVE